ncbi:AAA family ATPase (membrane bound) [Vairimorpha necatrix]|uniref:AAA family ATPase (Membrane bound) n=1 Tax=Vairimorpha necatrix TaxID=6039 RepID=A0AAX4JB50_9MICR
MSVQNYDQNDTQKIFYLNDNRKKSTAEQIKLILKIISTILNIFLALMVLFIIPIILHSLGVNEQKTTEFTFYTAKDFAHIEYHGKDEIFEKTIKKMIEIIELTETKSEAEVTKKIESNFRNFLLWGPPGTGKTFFIKKLIYLLNEKIKKNEEEKNRKDKGEKGKIETANGNKIIASKKTNAKVKSLDEDGIKEKEYVRAYFITPSMLEDKYKGETERKISKLFEEARDNEQWKATFIFVDEIDAFFSDREISHQDNSSKSKTEFLNLLSGIKESIMKNVFFVGASNYMSVIDDAFLRRFGEKIEFSLPNCDEAYEMLKSISRDWTQEENREDYLREIAEILSNKNCSQSFISELCKRMRWADAHKRPGAIKKFRDIVLAAEEKRNEIINRIPSGRAFEDKQYWQMRAKNEKFDNSDFDFGDDICTAETIVTEKTIPNI